MTGVRASDFIASYFISDSPCSDFGSMNGLSNRLTVSPHLYFALGPLALAIMLSLYDSLRTPESYEKLQRRL